MMRGLVLGALAPTARAIAEPNKPALDGLGIIGGNAHTDREYAEIASIPPRFYLLTRMVMELGKGQ